MHTGGTGVSKNGKVISGSAGPDLGQCMEHVVRDAGKNPEGWECRNGSRKNFLYELHYDVSFVVLKWLTVLY